MVSSGRNYKRSSGKWWSSRPSDMPVKNEGMAEEVLDYGTPD
jgi:hypothetical protein